MSFAFGNTEEQRKVKQDKECEGRIKEVCVYSGEKFLFARTGRVEVYSDGMMVRITEGDGTVTTVYNAVVVVKEKIEK